MDRWRSLLSGLRARGLTTVGLVVADPMAFADAFLGAVSAGFWVAPLDPSLPVSGGGGLAAALARAGVDVVLADRPAPSGVDGVWIELDRLEHMEEGPATRPGATAPPRAGGGVVLSSSGTTGTPKVVRLSQDKLLHTARGVATHLELVPEDRGFNPLPLFHINAEVVGLLSTLVAGSSLVLDDRFHRSGFWDLMGRRSITWINAVPAIVSRLSGLEPDETVPRRHQVHPLGLGAVAGGGGGPVRGEHGDPGRGDLRHDRGGQPDHGSPACRPTAPRIGGTARRGAAPDRPAERSGRVSARGSGIPHRPRRDQRSFGDRQLCRGHAS